MWRWTNPTIAIRPSFACEKEPVKGAEGLPIGGAPHRGAASAWRSGVVGRYLPRPIRPPDDPGDARALLSSAHHLRPPTFTCRCSNLAVVARLQHRQHLCP